MAELVFKSDCLAKEPLYSLSQNGPLCPPELSLEIHLLHRTVQAGGRSPPRPPPAPWTSCVSETRAQPLSQGCPSLLGFAGAGLQVRR